jgi:nitrite reductase/ring-hydroxylating ferredoxin subunit
MPEFIPLLPIASIPEGKSVRATAKGRHYAVCRNGGRFHVTDCVCPHAGGPLAGAEIRDGCIVCPIHYWKWDLTTGRVDPAVHSPRLTVYPCEVRDGMLFFDPGSGPNPATSFDLDCRAP